MTQRFSENGWPAFASTERYVRGEAAGFGFWAANADVAVVFADFVEAFDAEVEPIDGPVRDDWSWANRLVRGSATVVSNHGSATAIDLNALKHPRGKRNTFSAKAQATMHNLRGRYRAADGTPVLRLGMDYRTTPDDMHVEIAPGITPAQVRQAADTIRQRQREGTMDLNQQVTYTPSAVKRLEKPGDKLSTVIQWPPAVRLARDEIETARQEAATNSEALRGDIGALRTELAALRQVATQQAQLLSDLLTRLSTKP